MLFFSIDRFGEMLSKGIEGMKSPHKSLIRPIVTMILNDLPSVDEEDTDDMEEKQEDEEGEHDESDEEDEDRLTFNKSETLEESVELDVEDDHEPKRQSLK